MDSTINTYLPSSAGIKNSLLYNKTNTEAWRSGSASDSSMAIPEGRLFESGSLEFLGVLGAYQASDILTRAGSFSYTCLPLS
jgi:hypothetical protein